MSQRLIHGAGSAEALGRLCERARSVLVVTGKSSYCRSGAQALVERQLGRTPVVRFWDFANNPKLEDARRGRDLCRSANADLVVAVGGGSALDMAKLIATFAVQEGEPEDFVLGRRPLSTDALSLIALPTTCGTGSESTPFAVVYIGKTKYSLAHASMLPTAAILDANLLDALPPRVVAASGMDAFSQAVEAFWSVNSTDASREFSRQALELLLPALEDAVLRPQPATLQAMLLAANLAGQAIAIARTTAAHAASYPMTSFFGVAHGHAAALTLPAFMAFNAEVGEGDIQDPRGVAFVRRRMAELCDWLEATDVEDARQKCIRLMASIGLETALAPLGIRTDADVEVIVTNGFNPQRVKNNPRAVTEEGLRSILQSIR